MIAMTRVRVLQAAAQIVGLEIDETRFRRGNYYYVKYSGRRVSRPLSIGEAETFVDAWSVSETNTIERLAEAARHNFIAVAGGNGRG